MKKIAPCLRGAIRRAASCATRKAPKALTASVSRTDRRVELVDRSARAHRGVVDDEVRRAEPRLDRFEQACAPRPDRRRRRRRPRRRSHRRGRRACRRFAPQARPACPRAPGARASEALSPWPAPTMRAVRWRASSWLGPELRRAHCGTPAPCRLFARTAGGPPAAGSRPSIQTSEISRNSPWASRRGRAILAPS